MPSKAKQNVLRWADKVVEIRTDMGLTEKQYPLSVMLALIWVESVPKGNEYSHREGSQYWGLLQAGTDNVIDTNDATTADKSDPTAAKFLYGDGPAAIRQFFEYQERYSGPFDGAPYKGHLYTPDNIAIQWKSGPGALEEYRRTQAEEGQEAAEDFLVSLGNNSLKYLKEEFHSAWEMFSGATIPTGVSRTPSSRRAQAVSSPDEDVSVEQGAQQQAQTNSVPGSTEDGSRVNNLGRRVRSASIQSPSGCQTGSVSDVSGQIRRGDSDAMSRAGLPPARPAEIYGEVQQENAQTTVESTVARPSVSSQEKIQEAGRNLRNYLKENYYSDIEKAFKTFQTYNLKGSDYYTDAAVRRIRGFLEKAEGGTVAYNFQTTATRVATEFVKPIVDPFARNEWGQGRGYRAGPRDENGDRIPLRDEATGKPLVRYHLGVDYETRKSKGSLGANQPCYSIADGEVIRVYKSESYGRVIYIHHGNGITSRYAHLSEFKVERGEDVDRGQIIGLCGTSEGEPTGNDGYKVVDKVENFIPHLHFEIRFNINILEGKDEPGSLLSNRINVSVDPEPLLSLAPNPGEFVEKITEKQKNLREAEASFGKMAKQARDPNTAMRAAVNHDHAAAANRALGFSYMDRYDFTKNQARNADAQTRLYNKSSNS